ncbi:MAG: hypothetical protein AAFS12_17040 [Cyanobacteria bacterium J06632_19]
MPRNTTVVASEAARSWGFPPCKPEAFSQSATAVSVHAEGAAQLSRRVPEGWRG